MRSNLLPDHPLTAYQLLPPAFALQHQKRATLCVWSSVVCGLVVTLAVSSAFHAWQEQRAHQRRQQVGITALPLIALREQIATAQNVHRTRQSWCELVESAHPSDDALQTLAAVVLAADQSHGVVNFQRVLIQLPLESDLGANASSQRTDKQKVKQRARIEILARGQTPRSIEDWIDRLARSDRLAEIVPVHLAEQGIGSQVHVTCSPVASGVIP